MSEEIILHHYWMSPYAEKVRKILGYKGLHWKSVEIPVVAPKPDLTVLTGGYRKTPVLQVGADIFCDSDCIARRLEQLAPEPTLFPPGTESFSYMIGEWQQELFTLAVHLATSIPGTIPDGFIEDRMGMFDAGLDVERIIRELPAKRDQLRAKISLIEAQLKHGDFLIADAVSLADFSVYHPLFALMSAKELSSAFDPFPRTKAWMQRIDAFGHGNITKIEAQDAIEIARNSTPATSPTADDGDPNGRVPGDQVSIVHDSFGRDPSVGKLVSSSATEIAIGRHDDRVGEIVVHFPREHYVVLPA